MDAIGEDQGLYLAKRTHIEMATKAMITPKAKGA
jgi:hypothetical protein